MQRLGPYRIIRTIALGGMGEVFLAALERTGGFEKRVALKCVLPRLMADPRFVELFEREARLAAALTHRHIVQIFDFGQDQGRSWLAMEFVNGVDLKAVMDASPDPLPLGLAIEVGIACARGLDYAHRARDTRDRPLHLVHRDVSPQNVLLSFEGDVKLADFGLAHAAARDPHEGGLQGKFAYMSPEQVRGEALDGRSDQFALGVVLYEMFSGQRAFFGDDGVENILDRVRRAAPHAPLSEVAPHLPAGLVAVVERALQQARTDRFADAGALADALGGAASAAGLRPGEPPLGPWLRTRFPERQQALTTPEATATAGRPISQPAETTAAADLPIAPISTPSEHTVDASVPVGIQIDPLAATPSTPGEPRPPSEPSSGSGSVAGALIEMDLAGAETGIEAKGISQNVSSGLDNVSEDGKDVSKRRIWPIILLFLAGLAASTAVMIVDPEQEVRPDDGVDLAAIDAHPDTRPVDAAAPDITPPVRPVDARVPDARVEDARTPDARVPDARVVDARVRRPRRDASPRPMRDAAPPPPRDAAPPAPDARPPTPDAAVADTPVESVPQARVFAPGGRIFSRVPARDDWRPIGDRGLLLKIDGAPGPPVTVRLQSRGGRFQATVDARPWGRVMLGERDLGETPVASVPLDLGRQTLTVVGPARKETVIRIELADR